MYKFRLIVAYDDGDEQTYQDLIQLAAKHKLSYANNAERSEFILFITDIHALVTLTEAIYQLFE